MTRSNKKVILYWSWVLKYNYYDYMGSLRFSFLEDTRNSYYDYSSYGKSLLSEGVNERLNYIGKEADAETKVMHSKYIEYLPGDQNHGVRQYSPELGRFTTPDQMWEINIKKREHISQ